MSRRQQRRRSARRRAHVVVASGGLAAVTSLSASGVAHAQQTFTVTNLGDSGAGSLRAAIDAVNADTSDTGAPGDTILFSSGLSGSLQLTSGELDLTRVAQIVGPGAEQLTIHAAPGSRILHATGYQTVISGLTFTGGSPAVSSSGGYGGAIYANNLSLNRSVVSGNSSPSGGGGVAANGTLQMNASTISGNTAVRGGGIDSLSARPYNSTITGNAAPTGAGIYTSDLSALAATIANNAPTGAGGQVAFGSSGYLDLYDSIVAGTGASPDIVLPTGTAQSVLFSLVRNPSSAGAGDDAVQTDASDITNLDPQLAPLGENGGHTPTMVPLPTSPVLDRGYSFAFISRDQRGLPRPFTLPTIGFSPAGSDRSDIGAVEAETPSITAIGPNSGSTGTSVGISGFGFTGATQVLFGNTPASSFTVLSDETIVAKAPAQNGGSADIRVVTPLGVSPVAGPFTFTTFTPRVSGPHAKRSGKSVNTGIKVSCPAGGFSCKGSWKATATIGRHKANVASGSISLAAGRSKTITFKLGKKAYNQLKAKHKLTITIHIVVRDDSGGPVTVNRTITLHKKR